MKKFFETRKYAVSIRNSPPPTELSDGNNWRSFARITAVAAVLLLLVFAGAAAADEELQPSYTTSGALYYPIQAQGSTPGYNAESHTHSYSLTLGNAEGVAVGEVVDIPVTLTLTDWPYRECRITVKIPENAEISFDTSYKPMAVSDFGGDSNSTHIWWGENLAWGNGLSVIGPFTLAVLKVKPTDYGTVPLEVDFYLEKLNLPDDVYNGYVSNGYVKTITKPTGNVTATVTPVPQPADGSTVFAFQKTDLSGSYYYGSNTISFNDGVITDTNLVEGKYTNGQNQIYIKYPTGMVFATVAGNDDASIIGSPVSRQTLVKFDVKSNEYSGTYANPSTGNIGLAFTTPNGVQTTHFGYAEAEDTDTQLNWSYGGDAWDTQTACLKNVRPGVWKVQAYFKTGDGMGYLISSTPMKYHFGEDVYTFTVSEPNFGVELNQNSVAVGTPFTLTLSGDRGWNITLLSVDSGADQLKPISGQSDVYGEDLSQGIHTKIDNFGNRKSVTLSSENTNGRFTITALFTSPDGHSAVEKRAYIIIGKAEVTVDCIVTAEAESAVFYKGDDVNLTGTSSNSEMIYFYLKSHNAFGELMCDGGPLTTVVNADKTWAVTIPERAFHDLDSGPYTIYAVSSKMFAYDVQHQILGDYAYSPVYVSLKQPHAESNVTADAEADFFYLGEDVKLSGTSSNSELVYFYIKGANVNFKELMVNGLQLNATVNADKTWAVIIPGDASLKYDAGTYTIYAVSSKMSAPDVGYKALSDYSYAPAFVSLKQPFLTASPVSSYVPQGMNLTICGSASSTDTLAYYIFGNNKFESGAISVNEDYSYIHNISVDAYAAGQYFAIVQHPMYDRCFNISPVSDEINGGYNIVMDTWGSGSTTVLFNTRMRQSVNAAEALCQALDTQNIDDIYVKFAFIVGERPVVYVYQQTAYEGTWTSESGSVTFADGVVTGDTISEGKYTSENGDAIQIKYPSADIGITYNEMPVLGRTVIANESVRLNFSVGGHTAFYLAGGDELGLIFTAPDGTQTTVFGNADLGYEHWNEKHTDVSTAGVAEGVWKVRPYFNKSAAGEATAGKLVSTTPEKYLISDADEVSFTVLPAGSTPAVTLSREADFFYYGRDVAVQGTNSVSDTVYLYVGGPNKPFSELTDGTAIFSADVASDNTWAITIPGDIFASQNFDCGSYILYASTKRLPADSYGRVSWADLDTYAIVPLTLKQLFLTASLNQSVVTQGDSLIISGEAPATDSLLYYVFGNNKFDYERIVVENGKYAKELKFGHSDYSTGQYFIVVQHPMYDGYFNIGPVYCERYGSYLNNGYDIMLNPFGSYLRGDTVLFNTGMRQSSNAAEALCWALDTQNIDDIYVKLTFIVSTAGVLMEPMDPLSDVVKGQPLKVSGTTKAKVGTLVTVEMLSTAFAAIPTIPKESVNSASFMSLTTKVVAGADGSNRWEVTFDTSGVNVDEYSIRANFVGDAYTQSVIVKVFAGIVIPSSTTINPVSNVVKGSPLKVSGTTNINAGETVTVEMLSTAFAAIPKESVNSASFMSLTTKVVAGANGLNRWEVTFDTIGLNVDEYTVSANVRGISTSTVNVKILEGIVTPWPPTQPPTPSEVKSITLLPGWNFISVPKTLDSSANTAGVLFNGIDTANHAALGYNAETQTWEQMTETTVLSPLAGYWIYTVDEKNIAFSYPDSPTAPAVKNLYPGWNAIGLAAGSDTPASSALAGIAWRAAIPWNLTTGTWDTTIVSGGSSVNSPDQLMTRGNGYWLYVNSEGHLLGLTA